MSILSSSKTSLARLTVTVLGLFVICGCLAQKATAQLSPCPNYDVTVSSATLATYPGAAQFYANWQPLGAPPYSTAPQAITGGTYICSSGSGALLGITYVSPSGQQINVPNDGLTHRITFQDGLGDTYCADVTITTDNLGCIHIVIYYCPC